MVEPCSPSARGISECPDDAGAARARPEELTFALIHAGDLHEELVRNRARLFPPWEQGRVAGFAARRLTLWREDQIERVRAGGTPQWLTLQDFVTLVANDLQHARSARTDWYGPSDDDRATGVDFTVTHCRGEPLTLNGRRHPLLGLLDYARTASHRDFEYHQVRLTSVNETQDAVRVRGVSDPDNCLILRGVIGPGMTPLPTTFDRFGVAAGIYVLPDGMPLLRGVDTGQLSVMTTWPHSAELRLYPSAAVDVEPIPPMRFEQVWAHRLPQENFNPAMWQLFSTLGEQHGAVLADGELAHLRSRAIYWPSYEHDAELSLSMFRVFGSAALLFFHEPQWVDGTNCFPSKIEQIELEVAMGTRQIRLASGWLAADCAPDAEQCTLLKAWSHAWSEQMDHGRYWIHDVGWEIPGSRQIDAEIREVLTTPALADERRQQHQVQVETERIEFMTRVGFLDGAIDATALITQLAGVTGAEKLRRIALIDEALRRQPILTVPRRWIADLNEQFPYVRPRAPHDPQIPIALSPPLLVPALPSLHGVYVEEVYERAGVRITELGNRVVPLNRLMDGFELLIRHLEVQPLLNGHGHVVTSAEFLSGLHVRRVTMRSDGSDLQPKALYYAESLDLLLTITPDATIAGTGTGFTTGWKYDLSAPENRLLLRQQAAPYLVNPPTSSYNFSGDFVGHVSSLFVDTTTGVLRDARTPQEFDALTRAYAHLRTKEFRDFLGNTGAQLLIGAIHIIDQLERFGTTRPCAEEYDIPLLQQARLCHQPLVQDWEHQQLKAQIGAEAGTYLQWYRQHITAHPTDEWRLPPYWERLLQHAAEVYTGTKPETLQIAL